MYTVNDNLKNLYRVKAQQRRGNYLRLDMNENPEGLPPEFVEKVLKTVTPELLSMYPETDELIEKIALYLDVTYENITVTNGSDEAIKAIFDVFGDNGKKVVSVYPTFEMYSVYAQMKGMVHEAIEYDDNFEVSAMDIYNAIDDKTRIISLLNPNNPIGTVYSEEDVERIIQKAGELGAVVIIDEAYHYFYEKTFLSFWKSHENVIVLRTFSKLCSIAGLRIGYVVSCAHTIELIRKIRPTYCVNCVAIQFALAILNEDGLLERLIKIEREGRDFIKTKLKENNYALYAENGNYIFIKSRKDVEFIYSEMHRRNVLIKKYKHSLLKDYIRITTGSKEVMEKFWNIFIKVDNM